MINYYLITKPGIIMGNLVTFAAGFLLASKENFNFSLFLLTFLGLALIMASACVFNNYIDRNIDAVMRRTKQRPLVNGLISERNALIFATLLALLGFAALSTFANLLATLVAALGFFTYVVLYSLWKCHTIYGTAIGSIAGAVPPLVGYCAVKDRLDVGALILFIMLILWQMPHFFSIAIMHLEDYTAAQVPVLPIQKGMRRTKIHMLLYIIAFLVSALLLTSYGYTGIYYAATVALCSLLWLGISLQGFFLHDNHKWAVNMFKVSLVTITVVSVMITLDRV